MNLFYNSILENKGNTYNKGGYKLQIYSDGINGNIKRNDNTVLCRFYIKRSKQEIQFSFSKSSCSKEFGYKRYPVPFTAGFTEIEKIDHIEAKELCEVVKLFRN